MVVASSIEEVEVINSRDIESSNSKRQMLGDSTNGYTNDNNEGIDQRVPLPMVLEPHMPTINPTLDVPCAFVLDVSPTSSIDVVSLSTPTLDEFYKIAKKVPHFEAIILKKK